MLDIGRFQNNFKVIIQGGLKTVHRWTKDGEGEYVHTNGMEYFNGNFDVDINNIEMIGILIRKHINDRNFSCLKEVDLSIIDNRICWNNIENGNCDLLENSYEINDGIENDDAYICDYDVFVYINGLELTEKELRELFPNAD